MSWVNYNLLYSNELGDLVDSR